MRLARLRHPADVTKERSRGPFEDLAERGSYLASSSGFFGLCSVIALIWLAGFLFGASDRFEALAAGLMSAVTLLLVALLENAALRSERAVQVKLDAIAESMLEDKRGGDGETEEVLESAIGVHTEI